MTQRWLRVAILASLMLAPISGEAQRQPGPYRLLVLPVLVHSAEDPTYLRQGMADMLSSRLDQAGIFEVILLEDPAVATSRLSKALEVARGHSADFVLFGSFTRFGMGASLDMQCAATAADARSVPLREIFVHSGSIGEVIPDLDELVGKISRFVESDYRAPASPAADVGPPVDSLADLRRRVRLLEAAIDRLERQATSN